MRIKQRATIATLALSGTLAWGLGGGNGLPAAAADFATTGLLVAPEPSMFATPEDLAGEPASPIGESAEAPAVIPNPGTRTGIWAAWVECLYAPGEPRALSPCIPPPPCHPSHPPMPYDLVGVAGVPTHGPIYRGPCEPRTGTHDHLPFWRLHRVRDRLFDWFYRTK